ncbi:MAG: AcrR family transcriptional regulator [Kiritimatiellia bacterium]|jgi:AcrR family transcriptional regulator
MARPRQVSDEEILRVARVCFLRDGATVPTSTIAQEVGLSQGAIFKRFSTKENLMLCALAPPPEPGWLTLVGDGPAAGPVDEQLVQIGIEAVGFFRHIMPAILVLKSAGISHADMLKRYKLPPPIFAVRRMSVWFEKGVQNGRIRSKQPDQMAVSFVGSLQMRVFLQLMFGDWSSVFVSDEQYVRGLVSDLWNGIGVELEEDEA